MPCQQRPSGWLLLSSCALIAGFSLLGVAQEHTKDTLEMVKKAVEAKKALLIDVREKQEWDQGHLRDAQLLPLGRLKEESSFKDLLKILTKDQPIYLHCGAGVRVLKAAEILRKQGYDARPLKAGYKDLVKQGFPKADE
jgi:phage shock protein E